MASYRYADGVWNHLNRPAEIERPDNDRSASGISSEQATAQSDQCRYTQAGSRFVRVHRAHLDRKLFLARITIADKLFGSYIEILLADANAFAEVRTHIVSNAQASPTTLAKSTAMGPKAVRYRNSFITCK